MPEGEQSRLLEYEIVFIFLGGSMGRREVEEDVLNMLWGAIGEAESLPSAVVADLVLWVAASMCDAAGFSRQKSKDVLASKMDEIHKKMHPGSDPKSGIHPNAKLRLSTEVWGWSSEPPKGEC